MTLHIGSTESEDITEGSSLTALAETLAYIRHLTGVCRYLEFLPEFMSNASYDMLDTPNNMREELFTTVPSRQGHAVLVMTFRGQAAGRS